MKWLKRLTMFFRSKFLRRASHKVIACPRELKQYVVSRIPGIGTFTIPVDQGIHVDEGQIAVLAKGNRIFDTLMPGLHHINSQIAPLVFSDSPAPDKQLPGLHVYYVANQNTRHKWGTPQPQLVERPDSEPVLIQAYGMYSVDVIDVTKIIEFARSCEGYVFNEVDEHLRSIVVNSLPRVLIREIAESNISISELLANSDLVSQHMLDECQEAFFNIGLRLNDVRVHTMKLSDMSLSQMLGVDQEPFSYPGDLYGVIQQMSKELAEKNIELHERINAIEKEVILYRDFLSALILVIGIAIIYFSPKYLSWQWLLIHPHRLGLQIGFTVILLGLIWLLRETDKDRRNLVLSGIIFALIATIVQII